MESHADDADDADDADTERTPVKTYVPVYQKEVWREHAEDLDMSLSEFVRTMVQAGRRGFGGDVENETAGVSSRAASETTDGEPVAAAADGGTDLADRVLAALSTDEYTGWDDLFAAVTDDVEARLDETTNRLRDEGKIRHSDVEGGYALADDER